MPKTSPVSGQPVSRGWRFPLSLHIILALARQTFQYSVRRKVLLVLVIFALFLWVSFTVAPKSFPEKRVELVIQAALMLTSFFGVIVVVFLSSTTIPADLNDRTMVGIDPDTGRPKRSVVSVGARHAVRAPISAVSMGA